MCCCNWHWRLYITHGSHQSNKFLQNNFQHWKISANGHGSVLKWGYPNFFRPTTRNNQLNQISMRRIHLKLTLKRPEWPRVSLLCNIVHMLSIELTLKIFNIMFNYIVQFRWVCIATTQFNSTIKHIFICQPTRARNPIYNLIY